MCEVQLALFREKETILEMAEAVKLNLRRVSGGQYDVSDNVDIC